MKTCSSNASPTAWCATCTATSVPSHIVIEARELSIVDCVEFDERMRRIDVAADLAFLTMDLERLGALPLADAVERAYVARTGDAELHDLLPFYACYRAWVRGKVTALRIRQLPDR